jgi:hypothetical protein
VSILSHSSHQSPSVLPFPCTFGDHPHRVPFTLPAPVTLHYQDTVAGHLRFADWVACRSKLSPPRGSPFIDLTLSFTLFASTIWCVLLSFSVSPWNL